MLTRTKLVTMLALTTLALASPALAQPRAAQHHQQQLQVPTDGHGDYYAAPDSIPPGWQGGEQESSPPAGD